MAWRERLFVSAQAGKNRLQDKLYNDAKVNLGKILDKRRNTFWGETPIVLRSRKYKHGGEIRDERVAVIKPQLHTVKLYSLMLGKRVELKTTPQMLRYIEAYGGLDDYLLHTPDRKLNSDVASTMKWRISQLYKAKGLSSGAELILARKKELESERAAKTESMLRQEHSGQQLGGAQERGQWLQPQAS